MNLHILQNNKKGKKRIGRGGKRGTYSGRGQKGQKARAGHRIRPATRDLIIRTPKRKGFKNKPKSAHPLTISLNAIQKIKEVKITPKVLFDLRLLRDIRRPVKIVSTGKISDPKEISGINVSAAARVKIENAGGKVTAKSS